MPRLRQVSREENDSPLVETMYGLLFGDRDPVAQPGTATGTPGDWWTVFANDHAVFEHAVQGFGVYRGAKLGQTRAGWLVGSQFVYSQHCKSLRGLGVPADKISADCLITGMGRVPDEIFDGLRAALPDDQLLELTYITTLYAQHAVMSKALRTEFDDVDERIVEVDAPSDFDARDIVRDISLPSVGDDEGGAR
jgi:alkylhydroperoxidase family enzyme